jgi:hypothetical protein
MIENAIKTLSETPPPDEPLRERTRSGKLKFWNVAKANARMVELQEVLGLPPRPPIWNIHKANARVEQLEELLAMRGSDSAKPKEIAAATPAPLPVSASAAINSAPSTEQLRGLCAHLFGAASLPAANAPETIQRAALETRLREAGVKIHGLDHSKHIELTGFARANAAHFQARAEAFLFAQKSK